MKRILLILTAVTAFTLTSCVKDRPDRPDADKPKEVEIAISTSEQPQSRTPVSYPGNSDEDRIDDLDLLVFGANGNYLYRREAAKVSGEQNLYRAALVETEETLTIHLLANCRKIIEKWDNDQSDKSAMKWGDIHALLIDKQPWRLVKSNDFQPLPMWGEVAGKLAADNSKTKLGPVQMLRSVASVDMYVEKNDNTSGFVLTDMYLYYAPDMGYVGAVPDPAKTSPQQYLIPKEMTTSLNNIKDKELHADKVGVYIAEDNTKTYDIIANQMYLCENDAVTKGVERRPTRVIIGGYYNQPEDANPKIKSYYPIDIAYDDGKYRPVIRNWKYKFVVTSVSGSGHPTVQDAANAAQTDLNVEIIEWNRTDVEIGVSGRYYVSMERKSAVLWRNEGSVDRLKLTYRIEDDGSNEFTIKFREGSVNGAGQTIDGGIKNDYFSVTMAKGGSDMEGSIEFTVTALKPYTSGHDTDFVEIAFRNLRFGFSITQLDVLEGDWENGGTIPAKV